MSRGNSSGAVTRTLDASSDQLQYEWFTGFYLAMGLDSVRAVLKNKGVIGNFQGQLAYQVATVRTDEPGTPTAVANTVKTGAGDLVCDATVSSASGPAFFIRFGVAYKISSGTTPGRADVSLEVMFDTCGRVVGQRSLPLFTDLGSNGKIQVAVTDFFPAVTLGKVKSVIVISGATAEFRCELVYRTAPTSKEAPGTWSNSWTPAGSTYTTDACTGELAPSSAVTDAFMQVGLGYWSSSAGTLAQATVQVVTSVRK